MNSTLEEFANLQMQRCDLCKIIEKILFDVYKDDDSFVVTTIVENIRSETNIKDFAKGATNDDYIERLDCPHCIEGHNDTSEVIFGYIEDDKEMKKKKEKGIICNPGCVPDSFSVDIRGEWYYPKNFCNKCHNYFNYSKDFGQ